MIAALHWDNFLLIALGVLAGNLLTIVFVSGLLGILKSGKRGFRERGIDIWSVLFPMLMLLVFMVFMLEKTS